MRQIRRYRHAAPLGESSPLVHGLARVATVGLVEPDVVVGGENDVRLDVLEGGLRELAVPGGQRNDGNVRNADPGLLFSCVVILHGSNVSTRNYFKPQTIPKYQKDHYGELSRQWLLNLTTALNCVPVPLRPRRLQVQYFARIHRQHVEHHDVDLAHGV